jgi:AbrB family looped-hinge helix DNA binding protein
MSTSTTSAHATISSQYQITIPSFLRKKYHLKPGMKLVIGENDRGIYMFTRPADFKEFIMSIPKRPYWSSKKKIDDYIKKERASWDKKKY